MTEPASSAAASAGILATLFTATNIKWVLGGGALIYIIKLIYSAGRTTEKIDQVIEKVDGIDAKVDRNSAEHTELARDMAVMKNDIKHLKEKQEEAGK